MRGSSLPGTWRAVVAAIALSCLLLYASGTANAASGSYISFGEYSTSRALSAGAEKGVTFRNGAVRLARGRSQGTLTSKVYRSAHKDTFIPSWNARTPSGTWLRMEMRVRSGGTWTRWWDMGVWARGTGTIKRHSVNGQRSGNWRVLTDTLQSIGPVFADAYQYRLTLLSKRERRTPSVGAVYVTASNSYRNGEAFVGPNQGLWGEDIPVPARSQMIYKDGGEVWCSPTSLSMVMAYWANKKGKRSLNQRVPTVARGTYDYVYRGTATGPSTRPTPPPTASRPRSTASPRSGRWSAGSRRGYPSSPAYRGGGGSYGRADSRELGPPARHPGLHRIGGRDR